MKTNLTSIRFLSYAFKTPLLIIYFLALSSNTLWAQFVPLEGPNGGHIHCIQKVGDLVYVGGDKGLYVSTNEGVDWSLTNATDNIVYDIVSLDDTIFLLTQERISTDYNYYIVRSFDAGTTWEPESLVYSTNTHFGDLEIIQGAIYAGSGNADSYISHDKGNTWSMTDNISNRSYDEHTYVSSKVFVSTDYDSTSLYISHDGLLTFDTITFPGHLSHVYVSDEFIFTTLIDSIDGAQASVYLRSFNLGQDWVAIDTLTGYHSSYSSRTYYGADTIFVHAYGDDSLRYSADYGDTWKNISFQDFNILFDYEIMPDGAILLPTYGTGVYRYIPGLDTSYAVNTGIWEQDIYRMHTYDGYLYAAGNDIYKSTDGGASWVRMGLYDSYRRFFDVYASGDTIFAASSQLFYTKNGGITWDTLSENIGSVDVFGSLARVGNRIFVCGEYSNIFFSDDFGITWSSLPDISPSNHGGYLTEHEGLLYVVTNDGEVFILNEDLNFTGPVFSYSSPGAHTHNRIYSLNDGTLVVTGISPDFAISHDDGVSWITPSLEGLPINTYDDIISPKFIDKRGNTYIGSLPNRGLYLSTDDCNTWFPMQDTVLFYNYDFSIKDGIIYTGSLGQSIWRSDGALHPISGIVYLDANNNGIQEVGEYPLANILVGSSSIGYFTNTNQNGEYTIYTSSIGDTIRPVMPSNFVNSNPAFTLNTGVDQIQNFGLYIPANIQDLTVDISNINIFQPGFFTYVQVTSQNLGSIVQNAEIQIVLDPNLEIIETPPGAIINDDTISWSADLPIFGNSVSYTLVLEVPTTFPFPDSVTLVAIVSPFIGDVSPDNNTSILHEPILFAYDPNDKTCLQGNMITTEQIESGQEMEYIIRFQNTGNLGASFVTIHDTLSQYLDQSSFRFISSSHPCIYQLESNGVISFIFDPITLPSQDEDEGASHGFVKYAIKPRSGLTVGTGITNTAYITFDFNPAIMTNTTGTLIVLPEEILLETWDIPSPSEQILVWSMYPNPANSQLTVSLPLENNPVSRIEVLDMLGTRIVGTPATVGLTTLDIDMLPSGVYLCRIVGKSGQTLGIGKFVVMK